MKTTALAATSAPPCIYASKTLPKNIDYESKYKDLKFISLDSAGIDLYTAPCVLVGSVPSLSIVMA